MHIRTQSPSKHAWKKSTGPDKMCIFSWLSLFCYHPLSSLSGGFYNLFTLHVRVEETLSASLAQSPPTSRYLAQEEMRK